MQDDAVALYADKDVFKEDMNLTKEYHKEFL